jgi:hypothetical protein
VSKIGLLLENEPHIYIPDEEILSIKAVLLDVNFSWSKTVGAF